MNFLEHVHVSHNSVHSTPGVMSPVEGKNDLLQVAVDDLIFSMQARMLLPFFAARVHFCLMVNLFKRTHRSYPTKLLSRLSDPSLYCCMGLFLPRYRTFCLSFCWTFWCSYWLFSQANQRSCEWQHNHLLYQPLLPVFYHLKIWWGCTLYHHQGH